MISQALTIVASWRAGRHPPACFKRMRARVLSASCKHPAGARARRLPRRVRTGCAVRACARMPTCPAAVAPQRHSGQMTAQAASVSAMPPSVPSMVLRVPRIRCRPNRRPTALAAESATPSDTMPAKASARSCTHSPAGVVAALVSHTGAAMPGRAAADSGAKPRVRGACGRARGWAQRTPHGRRHARPRSSGPWPRGSRARRGAAGHGDGRNRRAASRQAGLDLPGVCSRAPTPRRSLTVARARLGSRHVPTHFVHGLLI